MANSVLKVQPTVESPDTDLEQRGRLAASLTAMLADAYVLGRVAKLVEIERRGSEAAWWGGSGGEVKVGG